MVFACIFICLFQPICAIFRCSPESPKRFIFNWIHSILGYIAWICSAIAISLACLKFEQFFIDSFLARDVLIASLVLTFISFFSLQWFSLKRRERFELFEEENERQGQRRSASSLWQINLPKEYNIRNINQSTNQHLRPPPQLMALAPSECSDLLPSAPPQLQRQPVTPPPTYNPGLARTQSSPSSITPPIVFVPVHPAPAAFLPPPPPNNVPPPKEPSIQKPSPVQAPPQVKSKAEKTAIIAQEKDSPTTPPSSTPIVPPDSIVIHPLPPLGGKGRLNKRKKKKKRDTTSSSSSSDSTVETETEGTQDDDGGILLTSPMKKGKKRRKKHKRKKRHSKKKKR
uniref:Cytochrome b561 domain-containing protein n=1 Tax=Meloidogyne javanica TaxID=6303 RepID=A0A915N185_MELJA